VQLRMVKCVNNIKKVKIDIQQFRIQKSKFRIWNPKFRIQKSKFRIWNPKFRILKFLTFLPKFEWYVFEGFTIQNLESRIQNPDFRIWNSEFRILKFAIFLPKFERCIFEGFTMPYTHLYFFHHVRGNTGIFCLVLPFMRACWHVLGRSS